MRAPNGRPNIKPDPVRGGFHVYLTLPSDPLTGKRRQKHIRGATRAEVMDKLSQAEKDTESATIGSDMTFGTWAYYWLGIVAERRKPSTWAFYRSLTETHLVPLLGALKLKALRVEHIEEALSRMTTRTKDGTDEPASASTKRAAVKTVRACLTEAVRRGHVTTNAARHVALPPMEEAEITPLTVEEVRAIVEVCRDMRNGARWLVALGLGLRQSEALGLQWDDVDTVAGTLTIRRTLIRPVWRHGCAAKPTCGRTARSCPRTIAPKRTGTTKTTSGKRTIALDETMVAALDEHRRNQAAERLRAERPWPQEMWVFANRTGGPLDHRGDNRQWETVLAKAGVRKVRLHDARHTAATMLLVQGVSARVVQDLLGWSEARMASRYQHVVPELARDAAGRMAGVLFGTTEGDERDAR